MMNMHFENFPATFTQKALTLAVQMVLLSGLTQTAFAASPMKETTQQLETILVEVDDALSSEQAGGYSYKQAKTGAGVSGRNEDAINISAESLSGNCSASDLAIYPPSEKPMRINFSGALCAILNAISGIVLPFNKFALKTCHSLGNSIIRSSQSESSNIKPGINTIDNELDMN